MQTDTWIDRQAEISDHFTHNYVHSILRQHGLHSLLVVVLTTILVVILTVGVMICVKKHRRTKRSNTVELDGYSTKPDKVTLHGARICKVL